MTVDDVRAHLRPLLERDYGMEGATYLMDRPPGGWGDLVTNRDLERELDRLRHELRRELAELRTELRIEMAGLRAEVAESRHESRVEMAGLRAEVHDVLRSQTKWFATFVVATQGVVVAAIGTIGVMLRFA